MNDLFVWFGYTRHHMETKIYTSYVNIKLVPTMINDNKALVNGIEFFYEIIFYTIIFSVSLIEIIRVLNEK